VTFDPDTRYYWKLSEHIFRYNHHRASEGPALGGAHTVNECMYFHIYSENNR
jgi:Gly-Xaa carboxypeptidase